MTLDIKNSENTYLVEIDFPASKGRKTEFQKLFKKLRNTFNRHIVINLQENIIFDYSFVKKLLELKQYCEKNNSLISLCGIGFDNLCILYLLKLDNHFEIYDNKNDAALRSYRMVKRRLKAV